MKLSEGAVVERRFRLIRRLGSGGMGEVWLAHHEALDIPCAVKFIHARAATGEGRVRFEREARAAARIRSPHVVQILDQGECDGTPYIAMEYLEGEDLAQRLHREGRLGAEETARITAQVAQALARAHAAGLVHRDLKPANVFLVRDEIGEVAKVLDFGVAKLTALEEDSRYATQTGVLLGTPGYMSPEQAEGTRALDFRSDLWSLAVVVFQCVTGEMPFTGDSLGDLLVTIMLDPIPVPSRVASGLPVGFDRWWERAAAREPGARFQSARELSEALALALDVRPAVAVADPELVASVPEPAAVGATIGGEYELVRLVGEGGMGSVYEARHAGTGRRVALKLVRGGRLLADLDCTRRFAAEAEALASIDHPAVVRHVAHGFTPGGEPFLAMEWLEGEDLGRTLERRALEVREVVALGQRIAEGLAAAHARGVVHRDIKPGNLFLRDGEPEQVLILDFGIARLERAPLALTATGAMVGTPAYMAPEQARGAPSIDARADLFSLGAVLFECLAGKPAFAGQHVMAVLAKVLLEDPPRLAALCPEVPPALDALVARLLAKDSSARPASAASVASELASMSLDDQDRPAAPAPAEDLGARSALTDGERRFLCVIIAGAPRVDVHLAAPLLGIAYASTRPVTSADTLLAMLDRVAGPLGAEVVRLLDGSVLVTSRRAGSTSDEAARAARCALAMREILPDVPIGMATGRAELHGALLAGPAIDAAARAVAAPRPLVSGSARVPIRVDDVTAGFLDARFLVGGDGSGLLLFGEREDVDTTRMLLGRPAPFVGRERDLASLAGIFEECVAEPETRAVLLIAPAGVGKSRLRSELVRALGSRAGAPPPQIWFGRGDPVGVGAPFALIGQAIRGVAGVRHDEPLPVRRQKLQARIGRHVAPGEAARVSVFLGEIAGAPSPDDGDLPLRAARADARLMGDQIGRAWEDFLAAECAAAPVLLILEDLHWGDLPSLRLVDSALRVLRDRPWMVLGLARPEVRSLFPDLWAGRGVAHVELRPLSQRAGDKLVRAVLGETRPPEIAERIVAQAAGNAFYLEELVRAEVEERDRVPPTIVAMAEARILALAPELRRILRAASVFGEVFERRGVLSLLGGERRPGELHAALDELVRAELIVRVESFQSPGDDDLAFRHAVVREAAYGMLTGADRALGHRLAGAYLEAAGDAETVVLAAHFEQAGEPLRAAACYRRAAQQSLEGNDFAAVIGHVKSAAALGAEGVALGEMKVLEAEALEAKGDDEGAGAAAALAMLQLSKGSVAWYVAAARASIAWQRVNRRGPFADVVASVREAPWSEGARAARVTALATAGRNALFLGDTALGREILGDAAALVGALCADDPASAVLARARGTLAVHDGEPETYLRLEREAAAALENAGNLRWAGYARLGAADALKDLGAYDEAERALRAEVAETNRLSPGAPAASCRATLGFVLGQLGKTSEAMDHLAYATTMDAVRQNPRFLALVGIYRARTLLAGGDAAGAEHEAEAAVARAGAHASLRCYARAIVSQCCLAQGRAPEALSAAREAMAELESVGALDEGEAFIRLAFAEALDRSGDHGAARGALAVARERLVRRAAKIRDERYRQSFSTSVAENARTLALASW